MQSHGAITSSFFLKFQCKGRENMPNMQTSKLSFLHFFCNSLTIRKTKNPLPFESGFGRRWHKKSDRSRVLSLRMIVSTQDRKNIK